MKENSYIDYSDYGRKIGIFIAGFFKNTSVHAYHLTCVHFLVMMAAAWCVSMNTLDTRIYAALLIMLKNVLDAADGSLARLQQRPSRVGRFLDSNLDFLGNLILFMSIPDISVINALAGFMFFTFQGSVYNYYSVLYRGNITGSDNTSQLDESDESPYEYDNPATLKVLYYFYVIFYKWQDNLIDRIDTRIMGCGRDVPERKFMELISALGPGFQYIFVIMMLMSGTPGYIPDMFYIIFNTYLIVLLFARAGRE